jgi:hypothetical protein
MSLGHGPSIIRSGLIFQVDFANLKSYPGSGTVVTNLNGTGNFTISGSPTFSNGTMYFNGVNGGPHMYETSSLASHGTNSFTYQVLVRPKASTSGDQPGASGYARIFEQTGFPTTYHVLEIRNGSGFPQYTWFGLDTTQTIGFNLTTSGGTAILNQWHLLTCMIDRTNNKAVLYDNTTRYETAINPALGTLGNSANLKFPSTYAEMEMDLSCAMSYSRALSDAEVKQNFEALRGRFGI